MSNQAGRRARSRSLGATAMTEEAFVAGLNRRKAELRDELLQVNPEEAIRQYLQLATQSGAPALVSGMARTVAYAMLDQKISATLIEVVVEVLIEKFGNSIQVEFLPASFPVPAPAQQTPSPSPAPAPVPASPAPAEAQQQAAAPVPTPANAEEEVQASQSIDSPEPARPKPRVMKPIPLNLPPESPAPAPLNTGPVGGTRSPGLSSPDSNRPIRLDSHDLPDPSPQLLNLPYARNTIPAEQEHAAPGLFQNIANFTRVKLRPFVDELSDELSPRIGPMVERVAQDLLSRNRDQNGAVVKEALVGSFGSDSVRQLMRKIVMLGVKDALMKLLGPQRIAELQIEGRNPSKSRSRPGAVANVELPANAVINSLERIERSLIDHSAHGRPYQGGNFPSCAAAAAASLERQRLQDLQEQEQFEQQQFRNAAPFPGNAARGPHGAPPQGVSPAAASNAANFACTLLATMLQRIMSYGAQSGNEGAPAPPPELNQNGPRLPTVSRATSF